MKCVECNGTGVFDRIDFDEIPCPVCDGDGEVEACVVCGFVARDKPEGRPPTCGRPPCVLRVQQAEDDYYAGRG